MRTTLNMPEAALKYILLQRTGLQKFRVRLLAKLGLPYFPHLCNLETRWRRAPITRGYLASLHEDFDEIKNHLPPSPRRILDIGCGVGGIDVLLNDHYPKGALQFQLLDKTQVEENIFYNFHGHGAFYNSLDLAKQFLAQNGVDEKSISTQEATPDNRILFEPGIGLIISLISWGFHYPVGVYLEETHRVLAPDGAVIIDVRKGTDGLGALRSRFADVRVISEKPKFLRVIGRR